MEGYSFMDSFNWLFHAIPNKVHPFPGSNCQRFVRRSIGNFIGTPDRYVKNGHVWKI